ncbi:MAG: hypothetical protein D6E12_07730 [Desulfovibrio sp.]|nr:MAG: hypothetical protein D6E12_07730 [Desulfovibrio sp.]
MAEVLARVRDSVNQRVALARQQRRNFDSEQFGSHLAANVVPVLEAGVGNDLSHPEMDGLALALVEASLRLQEAGLLAGRADSDLLGRVWCQLLPAAAHLIAHEPEPAVPALLNAAMTLARQSRSIAEQWLEIMFPLCSQAENPDNLLDAGKVAAWRAGMACWRESALDTWAALPGPLRNAVLDLPPDTDVPDQAVLAELKNDPWRAPGQAQQKGLHLVHTVGGFRGFGGQFITPPKITVLNETLFAFDAEACFAIHADCFGAVLIRHGKEPPQGAKTKLGQFSLDAEGKVGSNGQIQDFPKLAGWTTAAASSHTLAVGHESSHKIRLIAMAETRP